MALLAFCPRIKKVRGHLQATTSWTTRILSIGCLYKRAIVDPSAKTVVITSCFAWLFRKVRVIPFKDINAVTYGYSDLSTDQYLSYAHDSVDRFTVGLKLDRYEEVHLFSFVGEGTFENNGPFPDWFYWSDRAFDLSGSQENASRAFVDLLSKMIKVKVVPPSP